MNRTRLAILNLALWILLILCLACFPFFASGQGGVTPIGNLARTNVVKGTNTIAILVHPNATNGMRQVPIAVLLSNLFNGSITIGSYNGVIWFTNGMATLVTNGANGQFFTYSSSVGPYWSTVAPGGGSGSTETQWFPDQSQFSTNASGFFVIKSGAPLTNTTLWGSGVSSVPLTITAAAGQDSNLISVKNSGGTVIWGIGYDGVMYGEGANSPILALGSTAGHLWTASDTTGIGTWAAPQVTTTLLNTASNAVVSLETTRNAAVSNALVAFAMTASNDVYTTETTRNAAVSNAVVSLETTRNAAVSNALVAFTMAASNDVYTTETTRNAAVSNAVVSLETTRNAAVSNALAAYIDTASSNRVRLAAGTGGITLSQTGSGGVQTWTINDDDAGGSSTTNFAAIFAGFGSFGSAYITNALRLNGSTNAGLLRQEGVATFQEVVHVDNERLMASVGVDTATLNVTNYLTRGVTNISATTASIDWNGPGFIRYFPGGTFTLSFVGTPSAGSPARFLDMELLTQQSGTFPSGVDWGTLGPIIITGATNRYYFEWNGTNVMGYNGQRRTSGSGGILAETNGPTLYQPYLIAPVYSPGAVSNLNALGAGSIAASTNAGSQATVTNIVFKGNAAVGSNDASGTFSLHVNRSGLYRTIFIDAAAMVSNTTAGATFETSETASPTNRMVDAYVFSGSASNLVQFKLAMPEEWNRGTVKVKLWTWSTNNVATRTNVWGIAATAGKSTTVLTNADWGTELEITNVVSSAGGQLLLSPATPALTIGNSPAAGGNLVWFRIMRKPLDADDNDDGQQRLLGAWIQYKEQEAEVASW